MFHTFRRFALVLITVVLSSHAPACRHDDKDDKEEQHAKQAGAETEPAKDSAIRHNAQAETVVALDDEGQKHAGLVIQPLVAATFQPEWIAYGRLEEDPQQTFALRAPVAGILKSADGRAWPRLGENLANGIVVGKIEPRLSPVERADLASRLSAAHAEVAEVSADLAAARASYENKKELNTKDHIVSDRTLEEAEAKVKGQEARLTSAQETVRLIESSLNATEGPTGPLSLRLATGGEVIELAARPGESVEAGQPILRIARFDRLLARVELPVGENLNSPPARARVVVPGHENQPMEAVAVAITPTVNPQTGGQSILFQIAAKDRVLRPGMAAVAYLARPGEPQKGVMIPRSAVIRLGGRTWMYLQTGKDQFTRHAVDDLRPTETGWFSAGVNEGQSVVVIGAQALLSMEFTSQAGEEEEED